ncbi:MAG: HAMP domain-containing sensor histidine kinase [Anaerolineales bacterium]|jgi:two-component system OmpR family sensor kinase
MRLRWLPILAPAVLGLIVSLILNQTNVTNPIVYLRADLGTLILIMGVSLTILAAVVMLLIDWVERQRLKNLLEAADERRRFLRRLDHELKNPLTAIMAGLANVSAATNKDQRQDGLESVQAQVRRLSQLVAELRKLSDLEIRELDLTPVDVGELLQEVLALAEDQPESKDRQISLSVPQAPWPLPKIMADRDLLFLAVHNLFDNALKFTQAGARVEVRAQEDAAHVVIEVADTGPGIPESDVAHIWEELFRGNSARGVPGSGLGLALVRAIVARHDGEVYLRSRPGQGTVFSMRLPLGEGSRR